MPPQEYKPAGESTVEVPVGNIRPNKVEAAKKTYWFKRFDDSLFCTQEEEAWRLLNGRIRKLGPVTPPHRLVGVSSGLIFQQAVLESHRLHAEGKMEEAQAKLREAYQQEYESGLGKIEMPRNFDVIDQRGNPTSMVMNGLR